jgi:hypothetical protein
LSKAGLLGCAVALVIGGSVGTVLATSGGGSPKAAHGSGAVAGVAEQRAAAAWVASQVEPATVVSCDHAMCSELETQGYPAKYVRTLASAATLKTSGVVVVTPTALQLFGSSLVTAWAPAALATFGSGDSAISVRVVAPKGAAAYELAARQDQAERALSESALTQAKSITVGGIAAQELNSGLIDGRLMEAVTDAAAAEPIDIVDFGNAGTGASSGIPLRYADLAANDSAATMSVSAYVQALRSSMNAGPGPRPDRTQLLTVDGQQVLRVEFLAPSPFGVLSSP